MLPLLWPERLLDVHVALGHEKMFLEYIPHLKHHFSYPAVVSEGVYRTPQDPGSSCDLKEDPENG